MRVEDKSLLGFKVITLEITLETKEEALGLLHRLNLSPLSVAPLLGLTENEVGRASELFEALRKALVERGVGTK